MKERQPPFFSKEEIQKSGVAWKNVASAGVGEHGRAEDRMEHGVTASEIEKGARLPKKVEVEVDIEKVHGESFIGSVIPRLIEAKAGKGKVKILDVGGGLGLYADQVRKNFGGKVKVFSTGLGKKAINKFRRAVLGREKLPPHDLKWSSVFQLSTYPEFDLIIDTYGEQFYFTEQDGPQHRTYFGPGSKQYALHSYEQLGKFERYIEAVVAKLNYGGHASIVSVMTDDAEIFNNMPYHIRELERKYNCKLNESWDEEKGILKIDKEGLLNVKSELETQNVRHEQSLPTPRELLDFRKRTSAKINVLCEKFFHGELSDEELQKEFGTNPTVLKIVRFVLESFAKPNDPRKARRKDGSHIAVHSLQLFKTGKYLGISDPDVLSAVLVHDILEDTQISKEQIQGALGQGILELAQRMTEERMPSVSGLSEEQARKLDIVRFVQKLHSGGGVIASAELLDRLDDISDLVYITDKLAQNPSSKDGVKRALVTKFGKCLYTVREMQKGASNTRTVSLLAGLFQRLFDFQKSILREKLSLDITDAEIREELEKYEKIKP